MLDQKWLRKRGLKSLIQLTASVITISVVIVVGHGFDPTREARAGSAPPAGLPSHNSGMSSKAPELKGLAGDSWLEGAQRSIEQREYWASRNSSGLQAPNRAHNLRTYFERDGIRVHDRTASGSPTLVKLSLVGIGRGEAVSPVSAGELVGEGARVEIRRPGLVEWYENTEAGLEQGFTLASRPTGKGALVLELAVAGARATLRGNGVILRTESGRRLEYGQLVALDATGTEIAARLEVGEASQLRLLVEDTDAVYPLVIDPLLKAAAKTILRSDALNDMGFDFSVAGAGDVNGDGYADVIVGIPEFDAGHSYEGTAFVFMGDASGLPAVSDPSNAASQLEADQYDARLGTSVAGAGDVNGDGYDDVIVGADFYDAGETDEGAAFVFLGSASGIVAVGNPSNANSQIEPDQANAWLGGSLVVAGAGDVNGDGYDDVIIGAPHYAAGESFEGAAFVFLGSASGIVAAGNPSNADSQIESNQVGAYLGTSVAGAGDYNGDSYADVIVGAPRYDNHTTGEGAAFVFLGSASGIAASSYPGSSIRWLMTNQTDARLGTSVAGAGDVNADGYADVIVGAPQFEAGQSNEGAAFLFLGSPSTLPSYGYPSTADSVLESDQTDVWFGGSVAGAGDVNGDGFADVIVGAPGFDADQENEGAAFVFLGSATGIADSSDPNGTVWRLESGRESAVLGAVVAGAGDIDGDGFDDLIVGAPGYIERIGSSDYRGAAFVYYGSDSPFLDGGPTTADGKIQSDEAYGYFGASVASAGDVNGDGYADVIVGAAFYDAGETNEGAAFVFLGSASGITGSGDPSNAASQIESNQEQAHLGFGVASAGDVNGDGYDDVIVGASLYDAGESDEGAAFIFLGGPFGITASGSPANAASQLESDEVEASLGLSVAGAGDVNGDGYDDVIVGAYSHDVGGNPDAGKAFVFLGSASGVVAAGDPGNANSLLEGDPWGWGFGWSVGSAGDVDADGYADVIVGSQGSAYVFLGNTSGTSSAADSTLQGRFAIQSAAGAGDVNGDGYDDVIVGDPQFSGLEDDEGAVFVFLGSASGIATSGNPSNADSELRSNQPNAQLGWSVAGAGDVNGDNYDDVIVGTFFSGPAQGGGMALVYLGSGSGIIASGDLNDADVRFTTNQPWADFGRSVAGAGDVNGDGYEDVIVGAPADQDYEGAAFVFHIGGDGTSGSPAPESEFSAVATSGSAPFSANFTDLSTDTPTSWLWNFGDGSAPSTQQHPSHQYAAQGSYTVSLAAGNANGSSAMVQSNYILVPEPASLTQLVVGVFGLIALNALRRRN